MTDKIQTEVRNDSRELMCFDNKYEYISPPVDIRETEEYYELTVEMPGVSREGFRVSLENGNLIVDGRMKLSQTGHPLLTEIPKRNYRRVFQLGRYVDPERIGAKWESGMLYITIGKREEAKAHEVEITFS